MVTWSVFHSILTAYIIFIHVCYACVEMYVPLKLSLKRSRDSEVAVTHEIAPDRCLQYWASGFGSTCAGHVGHVRVSMQCGSFVGYPRG